ncbi:hypothetical protein ACFQ4Y_14540 [Kroppenstedtia sanguinis]|uniref:Uncharacterized protein n=1 Tax=Kroppenstedtia sanguinis TaxID=1380684 RepID=A0ABW4CDZ5_9BACL
MTAKRIPKDEKKNPWGWLYIQRSVDSHMAKKRKQKVVRQVDHMATMGRDLKRVVLWVGISVGVTAVIVAVVRMTS